MLGLLFAFGLVGGLVGLACHQADDPTIKRFFWRKRLDVLASVPVEKLDLRGAEDGLALARRLGDRKLVERFTKIVNSKRRRS